MKNTLITLLTLSTLTMGYEIYLDVYHMHFFNEWVLWFWIGSGSGLYIHYMLNNIKKEYRFKRIVCKLHKKKNHGKRSHRKT